jgi:hypothetical protein
LPVLPYGYYLHLADAGNKITLNLLFIILGKEDDNICKERNLRSFMTMLKQLLHSNGKKCVHFLEIDGILIFAYSKSDTGHTIFGGILPQNRNYIISYIVVEKMILTIYITVLVTRGRHFGARESV